MFRFIQITSFFCILLILEGCKKDVAITIDKSTDECQSIPYPAGMALGYQYQTRDNILNKYNGMYDPSNPNYFYYLIDQKPGIGQIKGILVKVNLVTGEKIKLDSSIIGSPQINKSGWFTYFKSDWNVYKIKTSGDSLTKLTNDGDSKYPYWSYDDNYIFYLKSAGVIKMNKIGLVIDTLKNIYSVVYPFKNSNKILYGEAVGNQINLMLLNLDDFSKKLLSSSEDYGNLVFDNTDTFIYWRNQKGIYRLNISNGSVEELIKRCPNIPRIEYDRLNISMNSNYIVATRYDRKLINENTIYYETNLYKLNLDGSNPVLIDIP